MAKLVFSKKNKQEVIQEKASSKELAKEIVYYKVTVAALLLIIGILLYNL